MTKQEIYRTYQEDIYFFLLKKMQDTNKSKDVLQNTFLKAFENYDQLKDKAKLKSWLFQIARNEMIDFYKQKSKSLPLPEDKGNLTNTETTNVENQFCCFDLFISELPEIYKKPIQLIYKKGKKQTETAKILGLKLTTVKARVRRAKSILIKRFNECCQYHIDKDGKLIGEQNCVRCNQLK